MRLCKNKKKPSSFFSFFISSNFEFSLMNALVYVDIDRVIHKGKLKNALNEKRKKLRGFSFSINMANFEAFCRTKKLISNLFFLKSVYSSLPLDWPYFRNIKIFPVIRRPQSIIFECYSHFRLLLVVQDICTHPPYY